MEDLSNILICQLCL